MIKKIAMIQKVITAPNDDLFTIAKGNAFFHFSFPTHYIITTVEPA